MVLRKVGALVHLGEEMGHHPLNVWRLQPFIFERAREE
jgi:hypothetical protein